MALMHFKTNFERQEHQANHLMKAHKVPKTSNKDFQIKRKNQVPHELCDLSSARQIGIQTRRKRKPLGNTTKNTSKITEQV